MADVTDRADVEVERSLAYALRQRRPEGPAETGFCLSCSEDLPQGRRWCDAVCRDEWERLTRKRA